MKKIDQASTSNITDNNPERTQSEFKRPQNLPLRNSLPAIVFPENLPVSGKVDEISQLIKTHQVVIVCGETGSGKTTQLPKICLQLGRGQLGLIGHTQPRRIAATSTAKRIAQELQSELGQIVGFKVRFNDRLQAGASVKLMTDGILLAETQSDQLLRAYDTIIIDEAHERSLNIDFLLGFLKQLLPKRPDLKVIITSATIDAERFSQHFFGAPVIQVSGRTYPVEVRYRPLDEREKDKDRAVLDGIVKAVDELAKIGSGDVLVFLPGEREIREAAEHLRKHHPPHTEILPLYARLSVAEQERVFKTSQTRRIVLATNVAETSLTVPGIRYVVDVGLARIKRYSYRNKVEQLQIEPIAQASANQRAGRCGRVADGVCIRLYEEADFKARTAFTDPEILRSSLAGVILRMQSLKLGDVERFPFLEAPLNRAIVDGYQLLQELGAVDEDNKLTPLGKQLARLPLDPRIGRMILAARDFHCLHEVLIIASALSIQDPRDRPVDKQQYADIAHQKFNDEKSEFLSYVKLWNWFSDALTHKKSHRQIANLCYENFLSNLRLREWRDVHSQLLTTVAEQGWKINTLPATFEQVHCALLAGLLGNLACKQDEGNGYTAARSINCQTWPGTRLKKIGRWIVAAELIETQRIYARTLAQIAPEWIEKVGSHLLRKSWSNAHWDKKIGYVKAHERATLYGLAIYHGRSVQYSKINPTEAREIFIREALVNEDYESNASFFRHNQQLIREIENLEHKSRRQDVLVDESLIYAFYDALIPADICNGIDFESWRKNAEREQPRLLYLNRDDLMRHEASGVTTDLFPKKIVLHNIEMLLTYHFEPGSVRDGVTLAVPLYALNQINPIRCEWLVPGMIKEKVQLLLKSLPQKIRRHCVPLPAYAAGFVERYPDQMHRELLDVLIEDLQKNAQAQVKIADFKIETLPAHLFMNFKVVDEYARQLAMGRNLAQLRAELGGTAQQAFQDLAQQSLSSVGKVLTSKSSESPVDVSLKHTQHHAQSHKLDVTSNAEITSWTFGELPEMMELNRGKQTLFGYPALVDCDGTHCRLDVFDDPMVAQHKHQQGLLTLFGLQLKESIKFLQKNLPNLQFTALSALSLGSLALSQEELRQQIIRASLARACLLDSLPKNEQSFQTRILEAKGKLNLLAQEISKLCATIFNEAQLVVKKMPLLKGFPLALKDIEQQLQTLLPKHFILETSYAQLQHFPRYLQALHKRIDKLKTDPTRDQRLMQEMQPLFVQYQRLFVARKGQVDDALLQYRWLLEELRVSLFAQELRTPMPVSVKRLQKIWESLQR